MWGWKVWGQGSRVFSSRGALVCVWSCMCIPAHVCSGVRGIVLSSCFGVGRTRDAESGRGLWLVSGSVRASGARPWGQIGLQLPPVPPDPPDTPYSLPQALPWVVPPCCALCQPPSCWEGSAPFMATSHPFRLSALSFIFCKSSLGPSCAQVRVWEL